MYLKSIISGRIKLLIRLIEKYQNYCKNLILLSFLTQFPESVIYVYLSEFLVRDFAISVITMIPAYGGVNTVWEPKLYTVKYSLVFGPLLLPVKE